MLKLQIRCILICKTWVKVYINCEEKGSGSNEIHVEFAQDEMVQNIKDIENIIGYPWVFQIY